jgi:hypothetical protein
VNAQAALLLMSPHQCARFVGLSIPKTVAVALIKSMAISLQSTYASCSNVKVQKSGVLSKKNASLTNAIG